MRAAFAIFLILLTAASNVLAAGHELLALEQSSSLSVADRATAAKAEFEALERDEVVNDFRWTGPDGAEGVIIVSGYFPTVYGLGNCRRLVHIIRHKRDGGVSPTFSGVVCRNWEGQWRVQGS